MGSVPLTPVRTAAMAALMPTPFASDRSLLSPPVYLALEAAHPVHSTQQIFHRLVFDACNEVLVAVHRKAVAQQQMRAARTLGHSRLPPTTTTLSTLFWSAPTEAALIEATVAMVRV